jgi:hypothetical protein
MQRKWLLKKKKEEMDKAKKSGPLQMNPKECFILCARKQVVTPNQGTPSEFPVQQHVSERFVNLTACVVVQ